MVTSNWGVISLEQFKEQNPLKNHSSRLVTDTDEYANYVNLPSEQIDQPVGGWPAKPITTNPG